MHEYQEGCVATAAAKSVVIRRTNHHVRDESCRSTPRYNFDVSAGVTLGVQIVYAGLEGRRTLLGISMEGVVGYE